MHEPFRKTQTEVCVREMSGGTKRLFGENTKVQSGTPFLPQTQNRLVQHCLLALPESSSWPYNALHPQAQIIQQHMCPSEFFPLLK